MATDDVMTLSSSCLCGKGKIHITQTTPDHPYAKPSQTHYSGYIECVDCSAQYVIEEAWHGRKPRVVRRADRDAKTEADAAVRKTDLALGALPEAGAVVAKVIELVDQQPSMAARHRLLEKLRLARGSYSSFIKGAVDGASSVRFISGASIAWIAEKLDLPEAKSPEFKKLAEQLSTLRTISSSLSVPTIKTGATWMAA